MTEQIYKVVVNVTTGTFWYNSKEQLHRLDGPAVEYPNGDKRWYKEGNCHRLDGPAIERANGNKLWYKENKLHRLDGPAIEYASGDKEWYKEDQRHRLDGPAVEFVNGNKEWYIEGKEYTEVEFNRYIADMKKTTTCSGKIVEIDGKKYKLVEV